MNLRLVRVCNNLRKIYYYSYMQGAVSLYICYTFSSQIFIQRAGKIGIILRPLLAFSFSYMVSDGSGLVPGVVCKSSVMFEICGMFVCGICERI
jgi:hypothetical protein